MARVGKIARLPATVREELNRRLQNGQPGPQILPWLNSLPETREVLTQFFAGQDVNAQNLSDWRNGGFEDWLQQNDRTHRIRELAQFATKLAEANGSSIAEGACAIAAGKILELLEAAENPGDMDHETLGDLVSALTGLRSAELAKARGELDREKLRRKDEEIDLAKKKFEQDLREYQDKVAAQKREIEDALGQARAEGGLTEETRRRIEEAAALL